VALVLEGNLVRLEPLANDHIPALVAATEEDRSTYGYSVIPDGLEETTAYVNAAISEPDYLPFAIRLLATGTVVGTTRFARITPWEWPEGNPNQRRDRPDVVEIGYTWLAASAQRTGVNTEAKYLMLAHAFDVWDVHLVRIRTDVRNARSRAAIERLGATLDGCLRADMPGADGSVRDSAYYSISRAEWPAVRTKLEGLMRQAR
jgi:RimJ/RimL family protein N-acetyltransferase